MKTDTATRRPANPADNRLTVRFSADEIKNIVKDSRKRRQFPSDTVRQIIRLYYGTNFCDRPTLSSSRAPCRASTSAAGRSLFLSNNRRTP